VRLAIFEGATWHSFGATLLFLMYFFATPTTELFLRGHDESNTKPSYKSRKTKLGSLTRDRKASLFPLYQFGYYHHDDDELFIHIGPTA
jgi:hypothetical protein